jgi:hypothetical protein
MPGTIVIEGHLKWIIPLLIVIATAAFTLYTINPTIEYFANKQDEGTDKVNIDEDQPCCTSSTHKAKLLEGRTTKSVALMASSSYDNDNKKEDPVQIEKEELDSLEKKVLELKEKLKASHPPTKKSSDDVKSTKPIVPNTSVKEEFVSYTNSAEILRKNWRETNLPRTLEKYNGPIEGYNCGEYSEFTLNKPKSCVRNRCNNKYMKGPTGQSDYIFPGRERNTTDCIKYASKPLILGYEQDVNKKILEHESMNVLQDYKPEDVAGLERPQYMYHRRDGIDDPVISDENRFEIGNLNVFKRKTAEYSVE